MPNSSEKKFLDEFKNGRAYHFERDDEVLGARICNLMIDDPGLDATDGAHEAWWRGDDHGCLATARIVNKILDGEHKVGPFGNDVLEKMRQRLLKLIEKKQATAK